MLLNLVNRCNHNIFVSEVPRSLLNSLRVGISPDMSMAYIDVLYDESLNAPHSPLTSIGQPKFPIAFRLCGLGTYWSPWHLDTNDVVLHSISHAATVSDFIDEPWLNYIAELNTFLRTIRRYNLRQDLPLLLQYLNDSTKSEKIGGIILSFITFTNENKWQYTADERVLSNEETTNVRDSCAECDIEGNNNSIGDFSQSRTTAQSNISCMQKGPSLTTLPTTRYRSESNYNDEDGDRDSYHQCDDTTMVAFGRGSEGQPSSDLVFPNGRNNSSAMSVNDDEQNIQSGRQTAHQKLDRTEFFHALCDSICNGALMPGMIIYHKLTPQSELTRECSIQDAAIVDPPVPPVTDTNTFNDRQSTTSTNTIDKSVTSDLNSLDSYALMQKNARDVYGDSQLNEIEKFYRILHSADKAQSVDNKLFSKSGASVTSSSSGTPYPMSPFNDISNSAYSKEVPIYQGNNEDAEDEYMEATATAHIQQSNKRKLMISSCNVQKNSVWLWNVDSGPVMIRREHSRASASVDSRGSYLNKGVISSCYHFLSVRFGNIGWNLFYGEEKDPFDTTASRIWHFIMGFIVLLSTAFCGRNYAIVTQKNRKYLRLAIFLLCLHDIVVSGVLSMYYWCIWESSTECHDHTGVVIELSVWPGAVILSPMSGLICIILHTHGRRTREYATWVHLQLISVGGLAIVFMMWRQNAPGFLGFFILSLFISNRLQIVVTDRFIASFESQRRSRGWDGLATSLKKYDD